MGGRKPTQVILGTLVTLVALVGAIGPLGLLAADAAEETHRVKPKGKTVSNEGEKKEKIDYDDEEIVAPESVTLEGSEVTIISKTFKPPTKNWDFKPFPNPYPWEYVDIETDPDGLSPNANPDTAQAIKIEVALTASTAGTFPLRGEGNLKPPGGGGGQPPHWSAKMKDRGVEIIRVPDYLYADATAAVPVQFEFFGMGDEVEIDEDSALTVTFNVDGQLRLQEDYRDRFAAGDGFGAKGNGTADTYTVWVPIEDIRNIEVQDDLTDEAYFTVLVRAREASSGDDFEWYSNSVDDQGARPEVYGDASIQVIEIGTNDQWSVLDEDKLQTRPDNLGSPKWDHIASGGQHGTDCPSDFPHDASSQGCGMAMGNFETYTNSVEATNKKRKVTVVLDDGYDHFYYDNTIRNRRWDVRIGTWFGVSYGRRDVQVIGAPGMDLSVDEGGCGLSLFSDGKIKYRIEDVDDTQGNNLGIAAGALTIAWGLASGGTGGILGVVAGVASVLASQATYDDDTAEVVCQGFRCNRPPGGYWNKHQEFIVRKTQDGNDQSGTLCPLDQDQLLCQVGQSKLLFVLLNASCVASNWFWHGDWHAEAEIEYCVDALAFDAENCVQVQGW